jgi:hypothetical protein
MSLKKLRFLAAGALETMVLLNGTTPMRFAFALPHYMGWVSYMGTIITCTGIQKENLRLFRIRTSYVNYDYCGKTFENSRLSIYNEQDI